MKCGAASAALQHAMNKEREVADAQQSWSMIDTIKSFNWAALIAFMIGWSTLGYYVIPWIKGWSSWTPPTQAEKDEAQRVEADRIKADFLKLKMKADAKRAQMERNERVQHELAVKRMSSSSSANQQE